MRRYVRPFCTLRGVRWSQANFSYLLARTFRVTLRGGLLLSDQGCSHKALETPILTTSSAILNNTPALANPGRKKTKKDFVASELYGIHEFDDIIAAPGSSRLLIRRERLKGDLSKAKQAKQVLWQMSICAHSTLLVFLQVTAAKRRSDCNTDNPDLPPPWQALADRKKMVELLHPACIPPDENVAFGYNSSHTSGPNAKAFIEHWLDVGFLEFRKVWQNSRMNDPQPVNERWHMLREDDEAPCGARQAGPADDEEADEEASASADADADADEHWARSLTVTAPKFGSRGPALHLKPWEAVGFMTPIHDDVLLVVEDPGDVTSNPLPPHNPSNPIWTPPCAVPNSAWCRGQYVMQSVKEVRGSEMQAIQNACFALVQCPVSLVQFIYVQRHSCSQQLDSNYAIPLLAFEQSKSLPAPPASVRWTSDRAWLQSQEELESIEAYLSRKAWTFRCKGSVLFSGYSQTWCIILAALLYARGRAHKEVLDNGQPPNWARSGQDGGHDRARRLTYELPAPKVILLMGEVQQYLEVISRAQRYPGLPPSLMYSRFDTRLEYLRCLLDPVPELVDLLHTVQRMVRS